MEPAVETCGCSALARWRCDLCAPNGVEFLACSHRCLGTHLADAHGDTARRSFRDRAQAELEAHNRSNENNWRDFESHRLRLSRLLAELGGEGGICVLGAGNCDDLDVDLLANAFGEVHLVDFDGAALRRGLARAGASAGATIVLHEGIDLTGLLDTIASWGDDENAQKIAMSAAARAIAEKIGRTFRVVLSSGIISQLCVPFYRVLARRPPEWAEFMRGLGEVHLCTIALLTRAGGSGVLVGDALYCTRDAHDAASPAPHWDSLPPEFEERIRGGPMLLRNPQFLLTLLHDPALASLVERPEISQPWLWNVEQSVMLAYAVVFRRKITAEFDPALTEIHTRSNRETEDYWQLYEEHRNRLGALVSGRAEAQAGATQRRYTRDRTLCVLGAGNCNGLDLKVLAERFERIHLVDLDAAALTRAVDRQSSAVRTRLVTHAPLDLSGLLEVLPRWRIIPPDAVELASLFRKAPFEITAALPGPFDVVVSDCMLSQIYWTCFKALGNAPLLKEVLAIALAIHLRTLASLTVPHGTALLATDAITSETAPLAELFARDDPLQLLEGLDSQGVLFSGTSPTLILRELGGQVLRGDFEAPEIVPPWLWQMGRHRTALVYALALARKG